MEAEEAAPCHWLCGGGMTWASRLSVKEAAYESF